MDKKVKSHTRKTKDGVSRVKSHSKKSLGKKIATVAGVGVGLAALGLAGKKLNKTLITRMGSKKPKFSMDGPMTKETGVWEVSNKDGMLSTARQVNIDSTRKSVANIRNELWRIRQSNIKKAANTAKVEKRKAALKKEVDSSSYTFEPGSVEEASAKLNPNRKTRGAAATILKNTARNLRDRGAYFSKF